MTLAKGKLYNRKKIKDICQVKEFHRKVTTFLAGDEWLKCSCLASLVLLLPLALAFAQFCLALKAATSTSTFEVKVCIAFFRKHKMHFLCWRCRYPGFIWAFLLTSTLTAYLTPTRPKYTKVKVLSTPKKNNMSAEQLCRAILSLLLPYKRPYHG